MADAGEKEDEGKYERPGESVAGQEDLGAEPGDNATKIVPDADQGDEGADGTRWVPLRLSDLAHVVDGRQRAADAADGGDEQNDHVQAHQSLQNAEVLPPLGAPENFHHPSPSRLLDLCLLQDRRFGRRLGGRRSGLFFDGEAVELLFAQP